ncbi:unnamed protein product, partial [Ectocarpus sp. 12 AP-2014]
PPQANACWCCCCCKPRGTPCSLGGADSPPLPRYPPQSLSPQHYARHLLDGRLLLPLLPLEQPCRARRIAARPLPQGGRSPPPTPRHRRWRRTSGRIRYPGSSPPHQHHRCSHHIPS